MSGPRSPERSPGKRPVGSTTGGKPEREKFSAAWGPRQTEGYWGAALGERPDVRRNNWWTRKSPERRIYVVRGSSRCRGAFLNGDNIPGYSTVCQSELAAKIRELIEQHLSEKGGAPADSDGSSKVGAAKI